MKWIKLDDAHIPQEEGIRKVNIEGKWVCIIRHQDTVYATGVRCPHAGADLSGGWCEAGRVICPYHRHAFDLRTGRGDEGQGNYVRVYPLEQRGASLFIGVKESWWKSLLGK